MPLKKLFDKENQQIDMVLLLEVQPIENRRQGAEGVELHPTSEFIIMP